jgi:hypothetical protein
MKKILFLIIVGVGAILAATPVPANALIFPLDVEYNGTHVRPPIDTPWLTATFEDIDPIDDIPRVQLTLYALGLTDQEFVSEWLFNFDPEVSIMSTIMFPPYYVEGDSSGPDVLPVGGSGAGSNIYNPGGVTGHGFDIYFRFPPATQNDSAPRFTAGETVVFIFTGTGSSAQLTAESFNFLNETGPFYSAAHVEGDQYGGWIGATRSIAAIPEPATIILIGTGLASLFCIRRFRFKNN